MIQHLDVFLWDRKVGSLVAYKEKYAEKICFYFDRDFLNAGYDIAPLRASINSVSVKKSARKKVRILLSSECSKKSRISSMLVKSGLCWMAYIVGPNTRF